MISYSVVIKEEAEEDLTSIFHYYNSQLEGLGERFINYFEASLNRIVNNPYHTFNVNDRVRRSVTKVFPYSIYYIVAENKIIVFAVLHQSRKPDNIFKRLE